MVSSNHVLSRSVPWYRVNPSVYGIPWVGLDCVHFFCYYTGNNISTDNLTLPSIFFYSDRSMCIIQYASLDRKDTFNFQNQILAICFL